MPLQKLPKAPALGSFLLIMKMIIVGEGMGWSLKIVLKIAWPGPVPA